MKTIKRYRLAADIANMDYKKEGKSRKLTQRCLIFLGHLLLDQRRIQNKIDWLCMRHLDQPSNLVCSFLGQYYTRDIFERNIFGEGTFVKFEDGVFRVPAKYDEYLSSIYGEYMKLPPLDKQVAPHNIVFLDFDSEYNYKTRNLK